MLEDKERIEVEPVPVEEINKALRYKHDSLLEDLSAEYSNYSGLPVDEVRKLLKTNGSEPQIPEGVFEEEDQWLALIQLLYQF